MTEYFLDADSGNDGSAGTAIGTAWKTFSKYTATAVAGDLGTIRGGMSATYQLASPADLAFTADGTLPQPIRMEYDYDDHHDSRFLQGLAYEIEKQHPELTAQEVTDEVAQRVAFYTAKLDRLVELTRLCDVELAFRDGAKVTRLGELATLETIQR